MGTDLPDYTKYITAAPRNEIELSIPPESGGSTVVMARPFLFFGTDKKSSNSMVTDYLKQYCILPGGVVIASPCGTMVSYEGGYVARALISKAGSGEVALAKVILDMFAANQNADGSWYQQYVPYLNGSGLHDRVAEVSPGVDGNLKVDSGAALLAWAMAEYDKSQGPSSTIYLTTVQKALQFIRDLQYAHQVGYGTYLIANMIWKDVIDTVALAGDCGEVLLAIKACLDQYGDTLTTSGGYSVKTLGNNLYTAIAQFLWTGAVGQYYQTAYPASAMPAIPFTYKEKITYTQAFCSRAVYVWATSSYRTGTDYSSQAETCLDFINSLTAGQWGGQLYCPYAAAKDETRNEYSVYTASMLEACKTVNASKYAQLITRFTAFLRWLALADGRVYDFVTKNGELWITEVTLASGISAEGYGFLALPAAAALLAGA